MPLLRNKINQTALILMLIIWACWGCGRSAAWHQETVIYFDTVCDVKLFCTPLEFKTAQDTIAGVFTMIETYFSPGAGRLDSPEVIALFDTAFSIFLNTAGNFDITVAPLADLWGFRTGEHKIPEQEEINAVLGSIGMTKVVRENSRIRIEPDMALDWGGIAKGYGIDLASRALQEAGIKQGFINAGGDLFCWGKNPTALPWRIGIKHPRESGFLGILNLSGVGAATTGDYQRFFLQDENRFHHVFDPHTGYPAAGKQSVTVVGPETCICDALSTALFVAKDPAVILAEYPEYGAIIVTEDGEILLAGKVYPFTRE